MWVIVIIDLVQKIAVLAAAVTVRNVNGDIRSQRKYASGPDPILKFPVVTARRLKNIVCTHSIMYS